MRPLVVLRPEPTLSATRARAEAIGLTVVACPLFTIDPLGWAKPNPVEFDALLLTSANTLRRAGELGHLKTLPVVAVGEATAEAARDAGLSVEMIGSGGVDALLAAIPGAKRLLHLAGDDHAPRGPTSHHVTAIPIYRAVSIAEPELPDLAGAVVAVHSPRAGRRLAELAKYPATTSVVAISPAAAAACGEGWERIEAAAEPTDAALLSLARRLCQADAR